MILNFRTLKASEIDVKPQTVKENGFSLLLYKNARVDMDVLDETVGPMNWQRKHSRENANCIVSIYDMVSFSIHKTNKIYSYLLDELITIRLALKFRYSYPIKSTSLFTPANACKISSYTDSHKKRNFIFTFWGE